MATMIKNRRRTISRVCVKCRKPAKPPYLGFCDCGALIEVEYDLASATLHDSENALERFADLLPVESPENLLKWNIPATPCHHAQRLGRYLGMSRLYLKNETVLPTGTTKDRMACVSLAFLWESGVRHFCTSSTGNSSTAYAHAITRFPSMRMCLFTAEDFGERVDYGPAEQVTPFVLRGASFVDAFNCSAAYAKKYNLVSERGFFNPGRREGLKLAFLEAAEQVPGGIDWYVQAVSSAMGVYGAYKGARELHAMGVIDRLPRLLCVQQESCCPIVRSFRDNSETVKPEHIVHKPMGIAKAILRGDPSRAYPYVRSMVIESGGDVEAVSEGDIREARRMVEELEGISPCFSASAAVAGLIRQVRAGKFPLGDSVMINLTGRDRSQNVPAQKINYLRRSGEDWVAEDPTADIAGMIGHGPAQVSPLG